jgi:hypothetical protein
MSAYIQIYEILILRRLLRHFDQWKRKMHCLKGTRESLGLTEIIGIASLEKKTGKWTFSKGKSKKERKVVVSLIGAQEEPNQEFNTKFGIHKSSDLNYLVIKKSQIHRFYAIFLVKCPAAHSR